MQKLLLLFEIELNRFPVRQVIRGTNVLRSAETELLRRLPPPVHTSQESAAGMRFGHRKLERLWRLGGPAESGGVEFAERQHRMAPRAWTRPDR
jgi:hypothetical protein